MSTRRHAKMTAISAEPGTATIVVDRHAQIAWASEGMRELFDRAPDTVVGSDVFSFVHPDDVNTTVAMIAGMLDSPGASCRFRVRGHHAAGTWLPVSAEAVNRFDDRDIEGLTVVLRPSQAPQDQPQVNPLAEIFPVSRDIVVISDETFAVNYVSPTVRAVLGWEPDELAASYIDLVHPDDTAAMMAYIGRLAARTDGAAQRATFRIRDRAGGWRTMASNSINLLHDPDFRSSYTLLHDLTDENAPAPAPAPATRLHAAVNEASDPLVLVDENGRITFATPPTGVLIGRPPNELLGLQATELVHPDDVETLRNWFAAALEEHTDPAPMRFRLAPDGCRTRWVDGRIVNLLADESVRGLLVVMRDVTSQVEAEHALVASEARWRALVQNAPDGVMVFGADGLCTYASSAVGGTLDLGPEDCIGMSIRAGIHPDDLHILDAAWEKAEADPDEIVRWQSRVRSAGDDWHWFESTMQCHFADPNVGGMVVNFRDVTDRVEAQHNLVASERRFRALVQHSFEITTVAGADLTIHWISPSVQELLGWDPEDLVGVNALDFVHPDDHEMALTHLAEVLEGASPRPSTTLRIRSKQDEWHHVDISASDRLQDPDVDGFIFNLRDAEERVLAEQALQASERRYRSLAESSPSGIFQFDRDGRCTYVNDRWCEITGLAAVDALGDGWRSLFDEEVSLTTTAASLRTRLHRGDGTRRWVDVRTAPLTDDHERLIGAVATMDDVDEQVEAQREAERLTTILESTPDFVAITNRHGDLVWMNGAGRDFFGLLPDRPLSDLNIVGSFPASTFQKWSDEIHPSLMARSIWQGELALNDREGREVEVSAVLVTHRRADGSIELISGTARDISDRKALEARLEHEATHDPLTGLPNRTLLLDRLEVAMGRAHRQHRPLAVLFLDLDHFKVVNDSLGHSTGDQLLAEIATRLTDNVRPGDTVARFGGDEFVVICEDLHDAAEAEEIASRIAASVAESLWIADSEVFVTASVGIALASELHQTPEQVLRDADAAMYQAKARGRSRHELFDSRLRTRALDRLEVESALRRALVRHELRVHYQPVFELGSEAVIGVEALLRWEHPQRGLLLPAEFLRVAEETGLVVPVGSWVLRQACRQIQRLRVEVPGYESLQVAVNLSARQIGHPYLVEELAKVLEETNIGPSSLVLEITESVLMDDVPATGDVLRRLKDLGVQLAIDDFGTGYSSLAYLRRFPVDVLKVDRSFVSGLGDDPEDAAIANAVVTLAHTLGLVAVAEGVETALQRDELARLGCDQAQGFLLGRPMNPADLADFLIQKGPPVPTPEPAAPGRGGGSATHPRQGHRA